MDLVLALGERGLAYGAASGELAKAGLDAGLVDPLWIKGTAVPAHQFAVLIMVGISHGRHEEFEAR